MLEPRSTTQILSCGIHPHGLREQEAIHAPADLAHEFAVGVELEQPRAAVREDARRAQGASSPPVRVYTKMLPFEFVATPAASPRWRCSGSFSRSGTES